MGPMNSILRIAGAVGISLAAGTVAPADLAAPGSPFADVRPDEAFVRLIEPDVGPLGEIELSAAPPPWQGGVLDRDVTAADVLPLVSGRADEKSPASAPAGPAPAPQRPLRAAPAAPQPPPAGGIVLVDAPAIDYAPAHFITGTWGPGCGWAPFHSPWTGPIWTSPYALDSGRLWPPDHDRGVYGSWTDDFVLGLPYVRWYGPALPTAGRCEPAPGLSGSRWIGTSVGIGLTYDDGDWGLAGHVGYHAGGTVAAPRAGSRPPRQPWSSPAARSVTRRILSAQRQRRREFLPASPEGQEAREGVRAHRASSGVIRFVPGRGRRADRSDQPRDRADGTSATADPARRTQPFDTPPGERLRVPAGARREGRTGPQSPAPRRAAPRVLDFRGGPDRLRRLQRMLRQAPTGRKTAPRHPANR